MSKLYAQEKKKSEDREKKEVSVDETKVGDLSVSDNQFRRGVM